MSWRSVCPLEQLHDDELLRAVRPDVIDGADVRMIQRGGRARFTAEPFERLGILDELWPKEFQRDPAAETEVLGGVYDAHPACAKLVADPVMGDRLPYHERDRPSRRSLGSPCPQQTSGFADPYKAGPCTSRDAEHSIEVCTLLWLSRGFSIGPEQRVGR